MYMDLISYKSAVALMTPSKIKMLLELSDYTSFVSLLYLDCAVVSGVLSTPTNVRLTSNNMNLMLTWDSTDRPASSQVYTTQFK